MRYFVTGATGFIGGHVARQLVAAGHEVTALARTPAKAGDLAALGVRLAQGDITDRESMRAPMRGADGVFHIAGWYEIGLRDSRPGYRINVEGTRNVLELMRELGVPKGVYTSTIGVFSDTHGRLVDESYAVPADTAWTSEYERTKWLAHYEVAEPMIREGLPLVIVMPGLVYGPGDTSLVGQNLREYLKGRLPLAPQDVTFCWGHVEDTARAHLQAMEQGRAGESYIIAGPPHSFIEALLLGQKITGIPAPKIHLRPEIVEGMARLAGALERVVPLPQLMRAETLRSTVASYTADNSKARRELGFDPRPLEEGLRETLAYEMERLGVRPRV